MRLFDILVGRAMSSGGGGGSSDFSTATITAVDPNEIGAKLRGAFYGTVSSGPNTYITTYNTVWTDEGPFNIVLYKGSAIIDAEDVLVEGGSFSVSGSAEIEAGSYIIITGDCTITIS